MKKLKDVIINIISDVIATGIIAILTYLVTQISSAKMNIQQFLFTASVNGLTLIVICLILVFFSIIIYRKQRANKKELIKVKNEKSELSAKNDELNTYVEDNKKLTGYQLYKDFAYYKPEEGINALYCKHCMEDNRVPRRLQKSSDVFYECSSCGKRTIDHELQNRIIDSANEENRKNMSWLID